MLELFSKLVKSTFKDFYPRITEAPNENIVQNHLNKALLNVF